jgi:membrane-associated phospholipid phosphatase
MAGGGHFFTDVVFSGVFTFLLIWLVHGLLFRWRATRISDRAVERALERLALPLHGTVARCLPRRPVPPSRPVDRPAAEGAGPATAAGEGG